MARKQSAKDRLERLSKGCCPIHGRKMVWVDEITELCDCNKEVEIGTLVGCPLRGCGIVAATGRHMSRGPWILEKEFEYIMEGEK